MNVFARRSVGVLSLALSGCAVGPNYQAPKAPEAERYTAQALPPATTATAVTAGGAQQFQTGGDIPAQWWTLYGSPRLQALVEQALKANPDLEAAQATLRVARENMLATRSGLFPALDAKAGATRQKTSGASFGQPSAGTSIFNLFNASVGVSYVADVFGGVRRGIESATAQAEAQRYETEATYVALTANVVTAAIRQASLNAQLDATNEIIDASRRQLKVVQRQLELGAASPTEALTQQTQLAQLLATLPPLQKQREQNRNLLAVLLGQLPSQALDADLKLEELQLPADIPLSLPSKLVEQRPDVRAQAERLHQASAEIGVATANLLPQITISGNYGSVATRGADLFSAGTNVWSLGAGLTQPLFRAGELTHRRRAAVAAYEAAAAQYRSTVNTAFQNVADALTALTADADALNAQYQADQAATAGRDIVRKQYEIGAASYLALLTAERDAQQTRIALVQAQAARLADTAALFQALGGGWWNRDQATSPPPAVAKR